MNTYIFSNLEVLNRKNASCLSLTVLDFPDGPVFESLPAKSGDTGLILGTGGPKAPIYSTTTSLIPEGSEVTYRYKQRWSSALL